MSSSEEGDTSEVCLSPPPPPSLPSRLQSTVAVMQPRGCNQGPRHGAPWPGPGQAGAKDKPDASGEGDRRETREKFKRGENRK
jgi:hypothetical protein